MSGKNEGSSITFVKLNDEAAKELYEALVAATNHMACNEYDNRPAFEEARDKAFAVRKKYEEVFGGG